MSQNDDLISRQAAIDAIQKLNIPEDMCVFEIISHIEVEIATLPTVQPTIVRCRDCKYSIDEYNDGDCYCKRPSRELAWIGKSWDFFCKAGDKREGE